MSNGLQSVERALRILLSYDSAEEAVSVGELAAMLQVHKSTASRLTGTLRRYGFLERAPESERFRLGPELARLGLLAHAGRDLIAVSRKPMRDLAAATGETVTLAVLDGGELTTIAQVDSPHVIGPRSWIGRRTLLHTTSDGKVFLAFGGVSLPGGSLAALTTKTLTGRAELRRELAAIVERGWAQAIGELEDGLHGVAAPVLDADGVCRAALSVSGPSYRLSPSLLPELAAACVEAATRIASQLAGWTDGAAAAGAVAGTGAAAAGERVGAGGEAHRH